MDDQIERRIWNAIEKVALLNKESDEREATWLRHVLTLAGGALALLAALRQPEPLEGLDRDFWWRRGCFSYWP